MRSDWRTVSVIDLYEISSGLSKPRSEFGSGFGFLSFKDVLDNYFVPEKLSGLVNSTEKERAQCSVLRGDVFLTRTSETMEDLGMSSVALRDYPDATFNGFTKRLRPKDDSVVPEFAAYYFRSPRFRQSVTAMSSLSTRASLNNEMIARLKFVLPPKSSQLRIGEILKSLDDKIELNWRMNETLEAMARRLFKSWFVDFDPVHSQASLRSLNPKLSNTDLSRQALPSLPPEIAELFPDSFEDSTLGPIPKGWANGTVADSIDVNPLRTIKEGATIKWLDMKNMPTNSARAIDWELREFKSGTKFKNGDTLVARITPCLENGKTAFVDFLDTNEIAAGSTEFIVLRPKAPLCPVFAYFLARNEDFRQHLIANMTGTSGRQRVPANCINGYPLAIPNEPIAAKFGQIVEYMFAQMKKNDSESADLARARDALLPRLLSGQLEIIENIKP